MQSPFHPLRFMSDHLSWFHWEINYYLLPRSICDLRRHILFPSHTEQAAFNEIITGLFTLS